jgi:hypothetical protein
VRSDAASRGAPLAPIRRPLAGRISSSATSAPLGQTSSGLPTSPICAPPSSVTRELGVATQSRSSAPDARPLRETPAGRGGLVSGTSTPIRGLAPASVKGVNQTGSTAARARGQLIDQLVGKLPAQERRDQNRRRRPESSPREDARSTWPPFRPARRPNSRSARPATRVSSDHAYTENRTDPSAMPATGGTQTN